MKAKTYTRQIVTALIQMVNHLHLFGFALVTLLLFYGYSAVNLQQKLLEESIKQQSTLRDLLWTNLIGQRAAVEELVGKITQDPERHQRALSMTANLRGFLSRSNPTEKLDPKLLEDVQKIELLFAKVGTQTSPLVERLENLGENLNEEESTAWFELLDKNQKLLSQLKIHERQSYATYGLFVFYLFIMGWLTSRKLRADQNLREAQSKLASSAKMSALGEMAGGVAHEINTPLAVISLKADHLMELTHDEALDLEAIQEASKTIGDTVARIAKIVHGLRTFSRDGSKDLFEMIPAKRLVEDALTLCTEKIRNHGVELKLGELGPDLFINCRSVQISQVILNLVSNACDAIAKRKEKWIRVSVDAKPEAILIYVDDSGPGISPEVRAKLFQPFFTTKEIGKGTGLGLSISKGIVESHGGTLAIDAKVPHTRFVITLPRNRTPAAAA